MKDFDVEAALPQWASVVIGTPAADFEPRPPLDTSYRPDTIHDGWSSPALTLRMASVRGYAHRYDGRPREDDAAAYLHRPTGALLFALADGVSSTRFPHIAATLACRSAVETMARALDHNASAIDWTEILSNAAWQLVERAAQILELPQPDPHRTADLLATTLLAGVIQPEPSGPHVKMAKIGDTTAWRLRDGKFDDIFLDPAGVSAAVIDNSVLSLPSVPSAVDCRELDLDYGTVLIAGTDGFANPLGGGDGAVGQLFAEALKTPPSARGLARLLDFSRESFDDDRTLLAVWPQGRAQSEGA